MLDLLWVWCLRMDLCVQLLGRSGGGVDTATPAPACALLAELEATGSAMPWVRLRSVLVPIRVNFGSKNNPNAQRTEQLIEYAGGGPVVRYQHLEDIHNNTFRCLRVIDKTAAAGCVLGSSAFRAFSAPDLRIDLFCAGRGT
jgi:hypothetical protein